MNMLRNKLQRIQRILAPGDGSGYETVHDPAKRAANLGPARLSHRRTNNSVHLLNRQFGNAVLGGSQKRLNINQGLSVVSFGPGRPLLSYKKALFPQAVIGKIFCYARLL